MLAWAIIHMRGQSALEYLMTYGWVVVIILIAGGALYAMGILNPSTYTQKSCVGFDLIEYREHAFLDNGDFIIKLANGAGQKIQVNRTRVTIEGQVETDTNTYNIDAGKSKILDVTGFSGFEEGERYIATVQIEYSTIGGLSNHEEIGECTGEVE